ncbi:MAG TPA: amino acid adenylation domain-containing protein [Spirochaetia bacterium]|nr:amino acid adenylation domain-containing protein [Spirochaetia bacterium]
MEHSSTSQGIELSDLQRQMWHWHLLYPDSPSLTLAVAIHIENLDIERWRSALSSVIVSEPLCSMRVAGPLDEPRLEPSRVAEPRIHFAGTPDSALDEIMEERRRIALDPTKELMDVLLVKTAQDRLHCFLNIHHMIADGWSVKVLIERALEIYLNSTEGAGTSRSDRLIQRDDVDYRSSPDFQNDARYWERKLSAPVRTNNFFGRIEAGAPRVVRLRRELGSERSAQLRSAAVALGESHPRVGLANLLASVLFIYLSKMSGESNLSLGIPFANRRSESERQAFGLFMRIGVFRIEIDGGESFASLAHRVSQEGRETSHHIRYPLSNRDNRLYDVMLNVHNVAYDRSGPLQIEEEWLRSGNDSIPFTLHARTGELDNLVLEFDLQENRFPVGLRDEVAEQFLYILDQAIENPGIAVSELALSRLPGPFDSAPPARSSGLPIESRIEELFERAARKVKRKTAVFAGAARISFGELDDRAGRIAAALRKQGCSQGSIVAVQLDRSIGATTAILAVLKAGGIWMPLDPHYPARLRRFMLSDSGARFAISDGTPPPPVAGEQQGAEVKGTSDGKEAIWIAVDRNNGELIGTTCTAPQPEGIRGEGAFAAAAPPDNYSESMPAYCLYTSGSTGRPKGVIGSHAAALNRIRWMWRELPLASDEMLLHKTSLNFIDSVWEIFGALLSGHSIVIAEEAEVRDPHLLGALVERYPIGRIILVPALLRAVLESPGGFPGGLRKLGRWFLTGELLDANTLRRLQRILPAAELYNLYGTTETYDASCHRIEEKDLDRGLIPIGRAVDNMELWVLDSRLRALPPGVRGELFVRGIGVGSGYLNRPELTSQRFLPPAVETNPLDGGYLFRTGDAARVLSNGEVECLGRVDNMVKLSGYRIELEEVEHALLCLEGVAQAIALVDSPGSADARLVAYVTPAPGYLLQDSRLRSQLRATLPHWMIPTVRIVESLPRTPSGKLLRRHPDLDFRINNGARTIDEPPVKRNDKPNGDMEERLLAIWQRVLNVPPICVEDDFFDLGGTSLQAVRVTALIERELGVHLPLSALFESPTVRSFALKNLEGARAVNASPVVIRAGNPSKTPLFSVPPAGSTVSAFGLLARGLSSDQSLFSFQPRGVEEGEVPHLSIEEMAEAYVREMKEVQPQGPYLLSGRCFGGYVAYEMAQRLLAAGDRVAALIIIDSPEAPLAAEQQRAHVGLRKLLLYYPGRMRYFLKRGRLLFTLKMKIKNDLSYALERLLARAKPGRKNSRQRRLQMLRHLHTLAYHSYIASPYPGPITIFWAEGLPDITGEREKWEKLAQGGVEWYTFPSRHHDLLKEPNIKNVALQLSRCLERVHASIGETTI